MINEVYNQRILELAGNIPCLERLDKPGASASAQSKLCGSQVTIDLTLEGGRIAAFGQEVKACALGQASSSIMARNIIGETPASLFQLRDQAYAMLKAEGEPPKGKWADMEVLLPVRDFKARHASTLLTFDAVAGALEKLGYEPETAGAGA